MSTVITPVARGDAGMLVSRAALFPSDTPQAARTSFNIRRWRLRGFTLVSLNFRIDLVVVRIE
jgi:hypothetical protein